MLPARQYWPSLCLNSRSGPQGISTNIGLPKGGLLGYNDCCAVVGMSEISITGWLDQYSVLAHKYINIQHR